MLYNLCNQWFQLVHERLGAGDRYYGDHFLSFGFCERVKLSLPESCLWLTPMGKELSLSSPSLTS